MTGYVKIFVCNRTMSFKICENKLLKKYNQMWKIVEKLLKAKFYSEPAYGDNDKYINTKNKKKLVVKAKEKHYPQTLIRIIC